MLIITRFVRATHIEGGALDLSWREPVASVNILLTSTCWRNDHNGFSHQGPGLIDAALSSKGAVSRVYFPPDANCLLSVADHCLRSRNYVNLIVIDKQLHLQFLPMQQAIEHCTRGLSIWQWASNADSIEPDVVLACAGDVMTMETVAAAWWLRHHLPELKVRVVKIIVLNAGSSSQKSKLYELAEELPEQPPRPLWEATADWAEHRGETDPKVTTVHGETVAEKLPTDSRRAVIEHLLNTLAGGKTQVLSQLTEIDIVGP